MDKAGGCVKAGLPAGRGKPYLRAMSSDDERARRLAEALRANLKRRKQQARDRDSAADAPPPTKDQSGAVT
jgi:hypothetical protein